MQHTRPRAEEGTNGPIQTHIAFLLPINSTPLTGLLVGLLVGPFVPTAHKPPGSRQPPPARAGLVATPDESLAKIGGAPSVVLVAPHNLLLYSRPRFGDATTQPVLYLPADTGVTTFRAARAFAGRHAAVGKNTPGHLVTVGQHPGRVHHLGPHWGLNKTLPQTRFVCAHSCPAPVPTAPAHLTTPPCQNGST